MFKRLLTLFLVALILAAPIGASAQYWQLRPTYSSGGDASTAPAKGDEVYVRDLDDPTDDSAYGTTVRGTLLEISQAMQEWIQPNDKFRLDSTADAASWAIQIYDFDGAVWTDCLSFTNGNTPTITLGSGCSLAGLASLNLSAATDYKVGGSAWMDDTKGNGDTGNLLSADKIYDMVQEVSLDGICYVIDGGGSPISTGTKGHLSIPYAATIRSATVLADQTGSIVVDINKSSYINFPTTASITGANPPTITSAQKSQDITLSGWTTAIAADDVLEFQVDSASTITRCTVCLKVEK